MKEDELFKTVAEEKMPDFEKVRNNILSPEKKIKKKNHIKPIIAVAASVVAVTAAVVFVSVGGFPKTESAHGEAVLQKDKMLNDRETGNTEIALESQTYEAAEDKILINKGKNLIKADYNALFKNPENKPDFESLLTLPKGFSLEGYGQVYIPANIEIMPEGGYTEKDYTELAFLCASFGNGDPVKYLNMSFSCVGVPLKDTVIEGDEKPSVINNTELVIKKCGSTMQAEFSLMSGGKRTWFDICGQKISENEFIAFVKSVIKTSAENTVFISPFEEKTENDGTATVYTEGYTENPAYIPTPRYAPDEAVSNGYAP